MSMVAIGATGTNHDFNAFNSAGQIWNGSAFVAWNSAQFLSHRIAAVEDAGSGVFRATAPTGTTSYVLRVRGTTLADSYIVFEKDTVEISAASVSAIAAAGGVTVYSPVSASGQITTPLVIGDDYKAAIGNGLSWNVPKLTGVATLDALCFFGIKNGAGQGFIVQGTVTDVDASTWKLSFDIPKATWGTLTEGDYKWSAEVRDASGNEVTRVRNADFNYRVQLVEKQT